LKSSCGNGRKYKLYHTNCTGKEMRESVIERKMREKFLDERGLEDERYH